MSEYIESVDLKAEYISKYGIQSCPDKVKNLIDKEWYRAKLDDRYETMVGLGIPVQEWRMLRPAEDVVKKALDQALVDDVFPLTNLRSLGLVVKIDFSAIESVKMEIRACWRKGWEGFEVWGRVL